jgi:rod shape-determining protein MreC
VPRNRTAKLAVLGSSVQRPASQRYSARNATAFRRRLVVGVLVALSLALVTVSFRTDGLSGPQSAGAAVLRPFQVAAERVARPFRDAYGWSADLVHAKSDLDEARRELAEARREAALFRGAFAEKQQLEAQLDYKAPPGVPDDFDLVHTEVIAHPTPFDQAIVIAAGSDSGIRVDAPVITTQGLVGRVTAVTSDEARVSLLVDGSAGVSAEDVTTGARGVLRGRPGSEGLDLDFVPKREIVREGDMIKTAGSRRGELPSEYPKGILIGVVTSVSQSDIASEKEIQVDPYVDFDEVDSVMVLVPTRGARR